MIDEHGNELNNYLYQYHYNGRTYTFMIPAFTEKEAEARMRLMGNAALLGNNAVEIPAGIPGAGLYMRLLCWWRNTFRKT